MEVKENIMKAMNVNDAYHITVDSFGMTDHLNEDMYTVGMTNLNLLRVIYKSLNKKLSDINGRIYGG